MFDCFKPPKEPSFNFEQNFKSDHLTIIPSFDRKLLDIISLKGEVLSLNMWIVEKGEIVFSKDEIGLDSDPTSKPLFELVIKYLAASKVDTAFLIMFKDVLYFCNIQCFIRQNISGGGIFFVKLFGSQAQFTTGISALRRTLAAEVTKTLNNEIQKIDDDFIRQAALAKVDKLVKKQVSIDTAYMESKYTMLQKYIESELLEALDIEKIIRTSTDVRRTDLFEPHSRKPA